MQITDTYSEIADNGAAVLLGVPVDNVSLRDAVQKIGGMVAAYHSKKKPRYVATGNVNFLIKARIISPGKPRDPELLHILRKADLVTADGAPLVTLSRLTRQPLKERVAGADLVLVLASHAAERGYRIFMLGSDRKTAKKETTILEQANLGLKIVGIDSPFVHLSGRELSRENESDKTIISKIISTRPDNLLLGFGNPKQEVWFERNREAQIYFLGGARRHGSANVRFVDSHRVLVVPDKSESPTARLEGLNNYHVWSSQAMTPPAQLV